MQSTRLILRLSSLGDVILSSTALEVPVSQDLKNHWLTTLSYSELLQGHPRIHQVISFDRRTGFNGWIQLCFSLWKKDYIEIVDLHRSLRTRLMGWLFIYWSLKERKKGPRWIRISKQRWKLRGYFVLKKYWPNKLRPVPWIVRYSQIMGGQGSEHPNLEHLLSRDCFPKDLEIFLQSQAQDLNQKYVCVMPSSRWSGKLWPVERYVEYIQKTRIFPVVLGANSDLQSAELVQKLKTLALPHYSGVGKWGLVETAHVLHRAQAYLGGDTGLAHLAEAVGTRAVMIFGPTHPDMGFGPWRQKSQSVGLDLWCRPCGKDGRYCHRIIRRYHCLKGLKVDQVPPITAWK